MEYDKFLVTRDCGKILYPENSTCLINCFCVKNLVKKIIKFKRQSYYLTEKVFLKKNIKVTID